MVEHSVVLFATVAGAAVIPFLSRALRFPAAALEIVYGVLLFRVVVHERPEWFLLLSEIGFVYLMFLAGMELDLRTLARGESGLQFALVPIFSLVAAPALFAAAGYPFFEGLAVAMVSAGIVLPVLKDTGLIRSAFGREAVSTAAFGEILSIAVLTAVDTYAIHGLSFGAGLQVGKLVFLLGLAILFLRVMYVVAWWNADRVEKVMESEDPTEEGIRAVIAVAFGGALLAHAAGVEPILGSFVAGVVFSHVFPGRGRFEEKVNAVGFGFLTPFFFMGVGAGFDLRLLRSPALVTHALILTLLVLAAKALPLFAAWALRRRTLLDAAASALLLSAPLSMLVVAGALGERMGLLTPQAHGALILAAVISSVVYPGLFRVLARFLGDADEPTRS